MQILTGNELLSGAVVYLDASDRWVEDVQKARVFSKDETDDIDLAIAVTAATGRIISLEAEDVTVEDGLIRPNRVRARIRAEGPSAPRFDRQPLAEDEHVSL